MQEFPPDVYPEEEEWDEEWYEEPEDPLNEMRKDYASKRTIEHHQTVPEMVEC